MKLSKLLKKLHESHSIKIEHKSDVIYEGYLSGYHETKEWKVQSIDTNYTYHFVITVKEIEPKKEGTIHVWTVEPGEDYPLTGADYEDDYY